MYVTRIPNRDSPPAVLLRESYREGGKVRSRTLANISDWPEAKIDSLRRGLAGETLVPLGAGPARQHQGEDGEVDKPADNLIRRLSTRGVGALDLPKPVTRGSFPSKHQAICDMSQGIRASGKFARVSLFDF